jgi:hypothetical protein
MMEQTILDINKKNEKKFAKTDPSERVLLLSHCMRHSATCEANMTKEGLECRDDCIDKCSLGRLRMAAEKMGYKGICIAPGGSMAINFVKKTNPKAIVAVACAKELEEGVCAVNNLAGLKGMVKKNKKNPIIVVVPLLKDGCVDTEVDEEEAIRVINLKE